MNILIKHAQIIEQIDQLIRLQATGSPDNFALRLGISKTKLYRVIGIMKALNAPIEYSNSLESFVYEESVAFAFGFYKKNASNTSVTYNP